MYELSTHVKACGLSKGQRKIGDKVDEGSCRGAKD